MGMDRIDYDLVQTMDKKLATGVKQSELMVALLKKQVDLSEQQLLMTRKIFEQLARPTLTGPDHDVFQKR